MGTCARLLIAALLTTSSGCMFAEAGYRSANDDRRHGRYASKSYGHLAIAQSPTRIWTASVAGSSRLSGLSALC